MEKEEKIAKLQLDLNQAARELADFKENHDNCTHQINSLKIQLEKALSHSSPCNHIENEGENQITNQALQTIPESTAIGVAEEGKYSFPHSNS